MYTVKQYKRDMADLGGIFSQISNRLLEAAHLLTRMGAAVEASGSLDPTTPEPPDGVRKTDPAPAPKPCKDHHVGSCSCDGQETGPHFPAPATRDPNTGPVQVCVATYRNHSVATLKLDQLPNTAYSDMVPKPPGLPCRVRIDNGAYMGKNATVIKALRGRKLRVRLENVGGRSDFEDSVYLDDVVLLEGSSPLPVYVPKAKTR